MRHDLIKDFEQRARAARDTAEHEGIFAEAKVLLSLAEYTTLLGPLGQPAEIGEIKTSESGFPVSPLKDCQAGLQFRSRLRPHRI